MFSATENALVQDGPAADLETPSPARILRFDTASGRLSGAWIYRTDPIGVPPTPPGGLKVGGLVELRALGNGRLLALERQFVAGIGNRVRLYRVDLAAGEDVAGRARAGRARPVAKRLVLDLAALGVEIGNIEGMDFGPRLDDGRRLLVLVSDDNFSPGQTTRFYALALDRGITGAG